MEMDPIAGRGQSSESESESEGESEPERTPVSPTNVWLEQARAQASVNARPQVNTVSAHMRRTRPTNSVALACVVGLPRASHDASSDRCR